MSRSSALGGRLDWRGSAVRVPRRLEGAAGKVTGSAASGPGGQGSPRGSGGLVLRLRREQDVLARMRGTEDRIADAITAFAGTMRSGTRNRQCQECT